MPLVTVSVSAFPNVPQLPGVPQLARSLLSPPSALPTLGSNIGAAMWPAVNQSSFNWGVLNSNNEQVLTPDSVLNFDNRNEWKVSDFPVQQGQFASYNKVVMPFEIALRFSKGGSLSDRTAFIAQIAKIAGDTNLYTIITPEVTYLNCNILSYEVMRRGAAGAYFLDEVDVRFRQIIQVTAQYSSPSTAAANTTNAQQPADQPATNLGNVQAQDPPAPAVTAADATLDEITVTADAIDNPVTTDDAALVPLAPFPALNLNIVLGGQNCAMNFYTKTGYDLSDPTLSTPNTGLYFDLTSNGATIGTCMPCLSNKRLLVGRQYLGFSGDLMFTDLQGTSDPDYTGLGSRFPLLYLPSASDAD